MVLDQNSGTTANRLGLGAEEAGRADEFFQFCRRDSGKILGRSATLEESWGDLVDPVIRALGGKDGGDEELKRAGVVQLAMSVRVGLF